jgi:predicted acylesterase/phospholipase RssA
LFSGVSVGAINATQLAQHTTLLPGVDKLVKLWSSVCTEDVARKRFGGPLSLLWSPSVYTAEPMRELISNNLDYTALRNSGKRLQIVSVNMHTGNTKICTEEVPRDVLIENVLASAVAPILYAPVMLDGEAHVDGGIRHVSPLDAAIKAGATEIDLILCYGKQPRRWDVKVNSILSYADRMIDLMLSEIMESDLRLTELHTKLKQADGNHPKRAIKLRVCRPAMALNVNSAQFEPKVSLELMRHGYEDALRAYG